MVYFMLADGFEEAEAIIPADLLRRAGVEVTLVGVTGRTVIGTHGISILANCTPEEVDLPSAEMIVLPGGMPGTSELYASDFVKRAVWYCHENNRYIAAICAAPSIILGGMGLLAGKKATCYPGMTAGMIDAFPQDEQVCVDGKLITARAAGAAYEFALAACAALKGEAVAEAVRVEICYGK